MRGPPPEPGSPASAARSSARPACPGAECVPPVPGGPRRGALRQVAEQRDRTVFAAAGDRPRLHRRQVLRLIDDHVAEAAGRARSTRPPRRSGPRRRRTIWPTSTARGGFVQRIASCSASVSRSPRRPWHRVRGAGSTTSDVRGHRGPDRDRRTTRPERSGPSGAATHRSGSRPARASDCRCNIATTRARTRSRPSHTGGSSRRTVSTIRRSASTEIRQR